MSSKNSLTFKEFNDLINKEDSECYLELKNKIPIHPKQLRPLTYSGIQEKAKENPSLEIGWLVKPGYIVIDLDRQPAADIIFNIIKAREEKVMVCKTTRGYHVYAKSNFNYKIAPTIIACGALADTIPHVNGETYITTPFKNPKVNTSKTLFNREVVYFNGIEDLPFWLIPVSKKQRKEEDTIIQFPHTNCRNDSYNRQLWSLKSSCLTAKQRVDVIHIINDYIATAPLSEDELQATVLRDDNNNEIPQKEFFNATGTFLHNKMGDFLIDYLNIKKGESGQIYHYNEHINIYESNEEYLKGQMTLLVPSLKDHQKNEVVHYLGSKLELGKVTFNKSPFTIVFKNGVLDMNTFEFKEHSPNFLETIQLNVNFNPEAKSETVDEFLWTASNKDEELQTLLYESIGYSLLKTVELASCFILTGTGRNGKSTFLDLVKEIVGKRNATSVDFKELGNSFGLSGLANKLVSLAGDISNQRIGESDMFKKIVSGDMVRIDEKYEKKYDTVLFTTLFFSANELPRTPDTTDGFYRRLIIIPFNANLDNITKTEGMLFKSKLLSEESLEYAAYKGVRAIKRVLDTTCDFTNPIVCQEEKHKYIISNSSALTWALERKKKFVGVDTMQSYGEYEIWAEANGYKGMSKARFEKEIAQEHKLNLIDGKFQKD